MRPNLMVGAVCLMSAAALTACKPAQSPNAAATEAQAMRLEAQPAQNAATAKPKKAVAKADAKTAAAPTTVSNAKGDVVHATTRVAAKQDDDQPITTTIAGCLELRDDGMFQLKDTDGEHAPKARSWKSGFVKKGAAKIDVLDAGNRLKLGSHVGRRVSISGTLTDRKMRARSLETTSEACE